MKGSVTIAKVFGIRIAIHWTFAILIGWVMLSGKTITESWWSIAFVLTIFLCVVLHEMGHALVAKRFGIGTNEINLLPIGGIAKIDRMPEKPIQEFAISIAGPIVNLIIAALLFFPVRNELNSGMHHALVAVNGENFVVNLFIVNISLAIFNLIPAFPMDGGRIFRALLSFKLNRVQATKIAVYLAQILAALFIIVGVSSNDYVQTSPTLLLISLFIFFGAQAELQTVSFRSILGGHHITEVTMKKFETLDVKDQVKDAIRVMLDSSNHDFIIKDQNKIAGTISRSELLKSLSEKGEDAYLGDCMNPDLSIVPANASVEAGYDSIQKSSSKLLVVMDQENLVGIVDPENILEFVMTRRAHAS